MGRYQWLDTFAACRCRYRGSCDPRFSSVSSRRILHCKLQSKSHAAVDLRTLVRSMSSSCCCRRCRLRAPPPPPPSCFTATAAAAGAARRRDGPAASLSSCPSAAVSAGWITGDTVGCQLRSPPAGAEVQHMLSTPAQHYHSNGRTTHRRTAPGWRHAQGGRASARPAA